MNLTAKLLMCLLVGLLSFFTLDWIGQKVSQAGQIDRRSKGILAYYYTGRIPIKAENFAAVGLLFTVFIGAYFAKSLGHWGLGLLASCIWMVILTQAVWIRSMNQNHKIDMELPHFIGLIRNSFLATNGNERFALEYAAAHATLPALKNPFSILSERWKNGEELQWEAEQTKRFFRNPAVWHLLDAVVQEHYGGGSFLQDLDRLAEQARDRFRLAEMRKVATAGSIYALYGVLLINIAILLVVALFDADGLAVFRETVLGKIITGLSMAGYSGVLFIAFRLIRLGDE